MKVEFSGLSRDDTKAFMVLVRLRHLKTACLFFGHRKHWLKIKGVTLEYQHEVRVGDDNQIFQIKVSINQSINMSLMSKHLSTVARKGCL